jgi:hypothetical protein
MTARGSSCASHSQFPLHTSRDEFVLAQDCIYLCIAGGGVAVLHWRARLDQEPGYLGVVEVVFISTGTIYSAVVQPPGRLSVILGVFKGQDAPASMSSCATSA